MSDHVTIPLARLWSATTKFVPQALHAQFALELLGPGATATNELPVQAWSHPLTVDQANQLIQKLNDKTVEVLKEAVKSAENGKAKVSWATVKKITGAPDWTTFAKGRLGGLTRSLRSIVNDDAAVLLWWDDAWAPDPQGDWLGSNEIYIDGPAVPALQAVFAKV
jgi:hypothetical protein